MPQCIVVFALTQSQSKQTKQPTSSLNFSPTISAPFHTYTATDVSNQIGVSSCHLTKHPLAIQTAIPSKSVRHCPRDTPDSCFRKSGPWSFYYTSTHGLMSQTRYAPARVAEVKKHCPACEWHFAFPKRLHVQANVRHVYMCNEIRMYEYVCLYLGLACAT